MHTKSMEEERYSTIMDPNQFITTAIEDDDSDYVNGKDLELTVAIQILASIVVLLICVTIIIYLHERQNNRIESLWRYLITKKRKLQENRLDSHAGNEWMAGRQFHEPESNAERTTSDSWGLSNNEIYKQEQAAKRKEKRFKSTKQCKSRVDQKQSLLKGTENATHTDGSGVHANNGEEKQKKSYQEARRESELLGRLLHVMNPCSEIHDKDKKAQENRTSVDRATSQRGSFPEDIEHFESETVESEERQKRDKELMGTLAEIRKLTSSNSSRRSSFQDNIAAAMSIIGKTRNKLDELQSSHQP